MTKKQKINWRNQLIFLAITVTLLDAFIYTFPGKDINLIWWLVIVALALYGYWNLMDKMVKEW